MPRQDHQSRGLIIDVRHCGHVGVVHPKFNVLNFFHAQSIRQATVQHLLAVRHVRKARQKRRLVNHHEVPVDFLDALVPVIQVAGLVAFGVGKDSQHRVNRNLLWLHDTHPVPDFEVVVVPHRTQLHEARGLLRSDVQVLGHDDVHGLKLGTVPPLSDLHVGRVRGPGAHIVADAVPSLLLAIALAGFATGVVGPGLGNQLLFSCRCQSK
mmetsp:Transcript_79446/g.125437  ORF Transcript_79446/g.125437 Transcript_79446/m.125437 type:complete len:210 (-) Transcript_79446:561-1190(-)